MSAGRIVAVMGILSLCLVPGARASHGSDAPVEGRKLLIKNNPSGNRLIFQAKDLAVDTGRAGSTGDPTCAGIGGGGGAIRVHGGGNDVTILLPCGGWRHINASDANADYLYRDATRTTCSKVVLRHGRAIKASCRGPQVDYVLGAPQGDVDVTIRTGSVPERNCSTFGPPPTHVAQDGSNGKTYKAKGAPPPPLPCTSSPSAAFID